MSSRLNLLKKKNTEAQRMWETNIEKKAGRNYQSLTKSIYDKKAETYISQTSYKIVNT